LQPAVDKQTLAKDQPFPLLIKEIVASINYSSSLSKIRDSHFYIAAPLIGNINLQCHRSPTEQSIYDRQLPTSSNYYNAYQFQRDIIQLIAEHVFNHALRALRNYRFLF
jgi:hypothetical protein